MKKTELKQTFIRTVHPDYKFSGTILRLLREDAKMSMKDLGRHLGRSEAAISLWELGRSVPSMEIVRSIAALFEIKPSDLITQNERTQS